MEIGTTFNDYFAEIVSSLNLYKLRGNVTGLANNIDIVDIIVLKFHNHPRFTLLTYLD